MINNRFLTMNNRYQARKRYKEIERVAKIPEYQKRKQEILNRLDLETNQKYARDLLEGYKKIEDMRENFLTKLSKVGQQREVITNKISDVATRMLLTNDKQEEKDLQELKNSYKGQLEQLSDLESIDIWPTIKKEMNEIMDSDLCNKAQKQYIKLAELIGKELNALEEEAKERALIYENLEVDIQNIVDNLDYTKAHELGNKISIDIRISDNKKSIARNV